MQLRPGRVGGPARLAAWAAIVLAAMLGAAPPGGTRVRPSVDVGRIDTLRQTESRPELPAQRERQPLDRLHRHLEGAKRPRQPASRRLLQTGRRSVAVSPPESATTSCTQATAT